MQGAFHALKETFGIRDSVHEAWKKAGSAYGGAEALLSIYATDPQDPFYFVHDCQPHVVDTARALKAFVMDLRPNSHGQYPFTVTDAPVVVDVAHGTLSVSLDRATPALAALSPEAAFYFSAWGIYQGPCRPELAGMRHTLSR